MHPHRFAHRTLRTLLACLLLVPLSGTAALEDKLVIVTSFPEDLTGPFQAAFESKYPQVKVEVLNKKTSAGVKYIQETAANNTSDLFWVSAPDAFGVLKGRGLLQKYQPKSEGIPDMIGSFPINDPDGHFFGFAASGYGIMYNTRYLKAKKLPVPKEWDDLKKPIYFGHVGMSAPSRSGTTHLTVEALLQGEGWDKGWASMKEMGGNFSTVTERSFGVPDGVNSGEFGIGIVIDFFGFSSRASGFPVDFVYPTITALVPANVGIIKNAPHPNAAAAFIDYLLSDEGQEILFDKKIQRLPVKPAIYAKHRRVCRILSRTNRSGPRSSSIPTFRRAATIWSTRCSISLSPSVWTNYARRPGRFTKRPLRWRKSPTKRRRCCLIRRGNT